MITPDCSKLGALDFLIWALFHFTWRKGGDGGEVTSVSTFSGNVPCIDFPLFHQQWLLKFLKSSVFQVSEKQPVVLSNQPVVLLLGVFEKVENCFNLSQPKQSLVSWFLLIVSLNVGSALNVFQINKLLY